MKRISINIILWLLLVLLTTEANIHAYNYVFIDPMTNEYNFGNRFHDLALLILTSLIFVISGVIMSWRLQSKNISILIAITIGIFSLSLNNAVHLPWFQLMSSHPQIYERFLAFVGGVIPGLSCACGAYLYFLFNKNAQKT